MRTEQEMLELILKIAKEDQRILAVYMNGSRTNPNAVKDIFQDYDIVYVVKETKPFIEDKKWIDKFGQRLYMQYPEDSVYYDSDIDNCYGWLMQLADGNRLDLHVQTEEFSKDDILNDSLCTILLDTNKILPVICESSDKDHWIKKPSQEQFQCTCNEFWWSLNNVAKGLWRKEIPYAQDMINNLLRPYLIRMLSWKIGITTKFSCSIGKSGKYMYRYLAKEEWEQFLSTYFFKDLNEMWNSVKVICSLFDKNAHKTAEELSLVYDEKEAKASLDFFLHVEQLPSDAKGVY